MRQGVTRSQRVNGAETVRAALFGGLGDGADIGGVGRQLGDNRDIDRRFHGGDDGAHHVRVLAHGHAVTPGVGTGQIQFQAVGYRREQPRHGDELGHAAAEDRGQQKAVPGHLKCLQAGPSGLGAGVGQPHRVDEAPGRVLGVNRLAIARARHRADAFRGDHAQLGHSIEKVLNDRRRGGHDARGDRKRAAQGFAEEFRAQESSLGRGRGAL